MNPTNQQILVIFGGDWGEREVSIRSAKEVVGWLVEAEFEPIPVRWDANGWVICTTPNLDDEGDVWNPVDLLQNQRAEGVGIVFNCLHGGAGEDGTLAGILSLFHMAHTGAGVGGSAVSSCKITFRQRMRGIGLRVPTGAVVHEEVWDRHRSDVLNGVDREIHYPCFVKTPQGGSSQGVHLVDDQTELIDAVGSVFVNSAMALVEKRVVGREISIPCLGGRKGILPQVLQPVEIVLPTDNFFSEQIKYDDDQADKREIICPAELDAEHWHDLAREIRQMHLELQLGTSSRTDLIIDHDNNPVYIETNTVPGMTKESLFPLSARKTGLKGPELVQKLVDIAVHDHFARWSGAASAS